MVGAQAGSTAAGRRTPVGQAAVLRPPGPAARVVRCLSPTFILSCGIPFALVPLVFIAGDRHVTGAPAAAPRRAWGSSPAAITALNVIRLGQQFIT
jgi:hypothetical protein